MTFSEIRDQIENSLDGDIYNVTINGCRGKIEYSKDDARWLCLVQDVSSGVVLMEGNAAFRTIAILTVTAVINRQINL